jgi:3-oxo-5-alpha-steroid 4-dehydrogenase 1
MLVGSNILDFFIYGWILLAIISFFILITGIAAPYGRYVRESRLPSMDNHLAWFSMEIVSPIAFLIVIPSQVLKSLSWETFLPIVLYVVHYAYRSLIFPMKLKRTGKKMPLVIVALAVIFNLINGSANGYYIGHTRLLSMPAPMTLAIAGIALFILGFILHIISDHHLIHLRKPGETQYKIPYGYLFRFISCPNYFGEIIQWTGFALISWNLAGVSFAVWTAANLVPRALSHHKWYKKTYGSSYPANRKALVPFIL